MAWMFAALLLCAAALAEAVPQNPSGLEGANALPAVTQESVAAADGELIEPTAEELIVSAMEVYSWFTISPLDIDPELPGADGSVWRVADEVLCDYEYVMQRVSEMFSPEVIADMLSYEVYTVIDGCLYTMPGGRAIDENISWVEYEDVFCTETMNVIQVTVHYFGEELGTEPDVFEFIRESVDGVWLFTQFPFFW